VHTCAKVIFVQRQVKGAVIRSIRESLGMLQGELAARAGISHSHMCKIEKGVETGRVETIARIARELGVSLDEIAPEAVTSS
jgi:transcriptional regulator with XRE-family HTH domain